jgi:hypothetical protein
MSQYTPRAIGLIAMEGYTVEVTLDRLAERSDLQRFIFGEALARLRKHWPEALEALLALTFFDLDNGATDQALAATVDVDLPAVQQALQRLLNLNLVTRHQSGGRFTILPLTRDFARQELTPEWEYVARERWSDSFLASYQTAVDKDTGKVISIAMGTRRSIESSATFCKCCLLQRTVQTRVEKG